MSGERTAQRIEVFGTVQGVGFRPHVHRLATGLGAGRLGAQRERPCGDRCRAARPHCATSSPDTGDAPPLARVRRIRVTGIARRPRRSERGSPYAAVPPTRLGTRHVRSRRTRPLVRHACANCSILRDRRYRYPFINCTDCGPRATVIDDLPYDRVRTAMRRLPPCARPARPSTPTPATAASTLNPWRAPTAAHVLAWDRRCAGEEALRAAVAAVDSGRDRRDEGPRRLPAGVRRGQRGRRRPSSAAASGGPRKPFAVMVRDRAAVERLARTTPLGAGGADVCGAARRRSLDRAVRGGSPLPSTRAPTGSGCSCPPPRCIICCCDDLDRPLVVTSGNRSRGAHRHRRRRGPPDAWRASPTASSPTTGRSAPATTIPWPTSPDAPCSPSAGPAASPPRPLPLPVPASRCWPPVHSSSTPSPSPRGGTAHHRAAWRRSRRRRDPGRLREPRTPISGASPASSPEAVAHDLHPGYLSTQWAARAGRSSAASPSSTTTPTWPPAPRSTACADPSSGWPTTGWGSATTARCGAARSCVADLRRHTGASAGSPPHPCRAPRRRCATRPGWHWATCTARETLGYAPRPRPG